MNFLILIGSGIEAVWTGSWKLPRGMQSLVNLVTGEVDA